MRPLTLLSAAALLTVGLSACGTINDPVGEALGVQTLTVNPGGNCESVDVTLQHAAQEVKLGVDDSTQSARFRASAGGPYNISAVCTYTVTRTSGETVITETKRYTTSKSGLAGKDFNVTVTPVSTSEVLIYDRGGQIQPVVSRVTLNNGACDNITLAFSHNGDLYNLRTSSATSRNLFVVPLKPYKAVATCTFKNAAGETVSQDFTREGTVSNNFSLDVQSAPGDTAPQVYFTANE